MRRTTSIKLLLIFLILSACEFSYSIDREIKTKHTSKPNGINCQNIDIERQAKVVTDNNTFFYGERIDISFRNIKGLKEIDQKIYPTMSIHIIKNEKDTVLFNDNVLNHLEEGTDKIPLDLHAYFTASLPYRNKEQYKAYIKVSDTKGEGTYTYELPFTIKESDLFKVTNQNIQYSSIYLWNQSKQQGIFNDEIEADDSIMLIMEGLDGFEQENGNVFPILSIDLKDAKGKSVAHSDNLFKEYENKGVNPEKFKEQIYASLTFDKGRMRNPYKLKVILKDKNSLKRIIVTSELNFK